MRRPMSSIFEAFIENARTMDDIFPLLDGNIVLFIMRESSIQPSLFVEIDHYPRQCKALIDLNK